jgi:hypothetical protein
VLVTAAVVALFVLAAALLVSAQAVIDYPAYLLGVARGSSVGVHPEQMINWRGVAVRLGAGGWLVTGGTLVTLTLVAAAWWWTRRSPRSTAFGAATAFIATPLVIPHSNQHEAILATLGILIAVVAVEELRFRLAVTAIGLHALVWSGLFLDARASAWLIFFILVAWLMLLAALGRREQRRMR